MVSFETLFFTIFVFAAVNALVTVLGMAVVLKEIGEVAKRNCTDTSTWFTIEKCEVVLVDKEAVEEAKP